MTKRDPVNAVDILHEAGSFFRNFPIYESTNPPGQQSLPPRRAGSEAPALFLRLGRKR